MVSIIVPLYNVESYVESSLKSAFSQTFEDVEFILVDDCSTDNTMDVVEKMVEKSICRDRIKIVRHKTNSGLSAARNTGMKHARGEYVFFMDSDDELTPDCIEKHYRAIQISDADFTIGNIRLEGAKSIHIRAFSDEIIQMPLKISYFRRMWSVSAWNKLFRKSFLEENGLTFQNGLLHEDILWSYNIVLKAKKAAWVKDATYIYKIRQGSITTSKNSKRKIDSLIYILNTLKMNWDNGEIATECCPDFIRFFNFLRFNTALLLLNYAGTNREAKEYYQQLKNTSVTKQYGLYAFLLKLPFPLFFLSMKPVYYLYKRLN